MDAAGGIGNLEVRRGGQETGSEFVMALKDMKKREYRKEQEEGKEEFR